MNDFEQKLKADLAEQAKALDTLMSEDNSLAGYMKMGFETPLSWLVKIGYVIAILLSIVMFFCGYQFFTAAPEHEVFWGVCLMLSFNAQVATKLWIFMQTNRNYLSRELRLILLRKGDLSV